MNYYSEEYSFKLRNEYTDVQQSYEKILLNFSTFHFKSSKANEFSSHGFCRRLNILNRCIENIYSIYPPEKTHIPSREELENIVINLQSFLINIYGCLDNLAWIWVEEKKLNNSNDEITVKNIGLIPSKNTKKIIKTFSQEFQDYLKSLHDWFQYISDFRHALAHRIPLYIPPHCVSPENTDKYTVLEKEKMNALMQSRLDAYNSLDKEQKKLMFFRPFVSHSLTEGNEPYILHPQLICDWKTIEEISQKFFEELK